MFSDDHEQVDNPFERFMTDHGTLFGYSLVTGELRSLDLED